MDEQKVFTLELLTDHEKYTRSDYWLRATQEPYMKWEPVFDGLWVETDPKMKNHHSNMWMFRR